MTGDFELVDELDEDPIFLWVVNLVEAKMKVKEEPSIVSMGDDTDWDGEGVVEPDTEMGSSSRPQPDDDIHREFKIRMVALIYLEF